MKGAQLNFSDFFNKRRIYLGLTLRRFCQNTGYDTAYISRIENGLISPPEDFDKLKALAFALQLEENSTEWVKFFDLAAASKGELPEDLKSNPKIMLAMPAFYRTLRNKKASREEIDKLLELLKGGEEADGCK